MLADELIRIGLRALLDDDEDLLENVEEIYSRRRLGLPLYVEPEQVEILSTFWEHALAWLQVEVGWLPVDRGRPEPVTLCHPLIVRLDDDGVDKAVS